MKKVRFIICTVLIAAAACVSAYAQEDEKTVNENENLKRGVITNRFIDNTFAGIGADITGLTDKGNKTKLGWAVDAYVGKWFSPVVGARIGYNFLQGREIYDPNYYSHTQTNNKAPYTYNFNYIHGDALLNVCQWFGGYKKDRLFNVIPYGHVGYLRIGTPNDHPYFGEYYDNEIAAGPGLIFNFQVTHRLGINLDVRDLIFSSRFHDYAEGGVAQVLTASIGVNYTFARYDWDRVGEGDNAADLKNQLKYLESAQRNAQKNADQLAAANKNLAAQNDDLQDKYNKLLDEMNTESPDIELVKLPLGIAPIVLYYDINSTTLGAIERKHLDYYVRNVLDKDPNRVLHLTGSADKGTGTPEINARLSAGRAEELKQLLISEYGLKEEQIVVNPGVIADNDPYGRLDRSVTIEH